MAYLSEKRTEKNREDYMDFLKGIAILAVVVGHGIAGNEKTSLLFHVIYSFHMPLLIFVSGYIEELNRKNYVESTLYLLWRRAVRLLIPYGTWCIITHVRFIDTWTIQPEGFWDNFIGITSGGLWFLPVLFGLKCSHLGFWKLAKFVENRESFLLDFLLVCIIEVIIVVLALFTDMVYLRNMITYAIPYFFGVFIVRNKSLNKLINRQIVITISMIAYIVVFPYFDFSDASNYTQILRIFLSVCMIIILINCKSVKEWKWYPTVCLYGQYSMGIYLIHGYMLDYSQLIQLGESSFIQSILAILISIAVCWGSILIYKLVTCSKFLGMLLFGK